MNLQTRIISSEGVISTEIENEIVLMHIADGKYYALNSVGSIIWSQISTPVAISFLCERITKEFDVEFDVCQRDVLSLVKELHELGLIQVVEE